MSYMKAIPKGLTPEQASRAAYRLSAVMLRDMNIAPGEAWPVVAGWNAGNRPPLNEGELERTFNAALARGSRTVGSGLARAG
jgi:hypothetical protein